MQISFSDTEVVLVMDKAEVMSAHPEVVDGIWSACQLDEKIAQTVGRFLCLGIAILIRGCLQFIGE